MAASGAIVSNAKIHDLRSLSTSGNSASTGKVPAHVDVSSNSTHLIRVGMGAVSSNFEVKTHLCKGPMACSENQPQAQTEVGGNEVGLTDIEDRAQPVVQNHFDRDGQTNQIGPLLPNPTGHESSPLTLESIHHGRVSHPSPDEASQARTLERRASTPGTTRCGATGEALEDCLLERIRILYTLKNMLRSATMMCKAN